MSFDSDPGSGDGSLPPVDVVIPDDARELARDVLAYRREVRARRRRERVLRMIGPLGRAGLVRHGSVFPLIATCAALSLLAGTMLSVVTISPASAPTTSPAVSTPTTLPDGGVRLDDGELVPTRTLEGSVLALILPPCDCGAALERLARQAKSAHVAVYFVYDAENAGYGLAQLSTLTAKYGDDVARTVYDLTGRLFYAFTPYRLTAVLVHRDARVDVVREFSRDLTPALRGLKGTH